VNASKYSFVVRDRKRELPHALLFKMQARHTHTQVSEYDEDRNVCVCERVRDEAIKM